LKERDEQEISFSLSLQALSLSASVLTTTTPPPKKKSAPLLDDPHAPPFRPVVPLERDAPGDEREQGVVPALLGLFCLFFFVSVFFSPSFLSLVRSLSLSPELLPLPRSERNPHHADPGARVHPRPALPHDDRPGPRRRAAAELDAEHFWELVAPVAGRAALLLRGAVRLFVVLMVFLCVCVGGREREGERGAVSAGGGREEEEEVVKVFFFLDRASSIVEQKKSGSP